MAERDFAQAGVFVRNFKNPSSTLIDDLVVIHSIGPQEPHELGVKSASGDLVPSEFPTRFAQELRSLYPVEREEAGAEGDASEPCRKRPTPRTPDTLDGLPPSRGDKWKHDKQARREQKQWDKFDQARREQKQARREQKQGRVIEQCPPEMAPRDERDDEQFLQELAAHAMRELERIAQYDEKMKKEAKAQSMRDMARERRCRRRAEGTSPVIRCGCDAFFFPDEVREDKKQREADANDKNDKNDGQDKTTAITRTRSRSRITNPPSVQIRSRRYDLAYDCKCWLCSFCVPLQHCICGSEGRCQSIDCRARHR
mgnify:CR=1 FL=1